MEQRDELEIETRLRAALAARSELVTHSTLRPGIPPNEHTAGLKSAPAGRWSWRRFLVPATVAAALAGGVFVGAQLPDDKGKSDVSAGSGGKYGQQPPGSPAPGTNTAPDGQAMPSSTAGAPSTEGSPSAQGGPTPPVPEASVATLHFTLADGWQVASIDATSACVTLKGKTAGTAPATTGTAPAGSSTPTTLPCGVDALYLKSDAAQDVWPRSTATKATGWWPKTVADASDITCPTAKPGAAGAANKVQDSVPLRSSTKYALGGGGASGTTGSSGAQTAVYHEWAVTCDEGSGVRPMLWELQPSGGSVAGSAKAAVVTVVSSDPAYDAALLGMVGSVHLAG